MDVGNPLRSVAPTVEADVLATLVRAHAPLTGLRVQQVAGRSYTQVRHVLQRLADEGLVHAERHGSSISYTFNRDHVLAEALETIVGGTHARVEEQLAAVLGEWPAPPAAAVLFGSFARRDGTADSDIDLLLVRPDRVAAEDSAWTDARYALAGELERWTGNAVQVVELSERELAAARRRHEPLVASLREEGRVVMGPPLRELLGARPRQVAR